MQQLAQGAGLPALTPTAACTPALFGGKRLGNESIYAYNWNLRPLRRRRLHTGHMGWNCSTCAPLRELQSHA